MRERVTFQKFNDAVFTSGSALPSPLFCAVENDAGALWYTAKTVYVVRFVSESEAEVVFAAVDVGEDALTEVLREAMACFRALG